MKEPYINLGQGIVAEDGIENDPKLSIYPSYAINHLEGSIAENDKVEVVTNYIDNRNNSKGVIGTKKITIVAMYLNPANFNTVTVPTMKATMKVIIHKQRGTNMFFWTPVGRDPLLTTKEKTINIVSNTENKDEETTLETSYYFIMDSINKIVKLFTGISDGEKVGYKAIINTLTSMFEFVDTVGNSIVLNSLSKLLTVKVDKIILESNEVIITNKLTVKGETTLVGGVNMSSGCAISKSLTNNGVDVGSTHRHKCPKCGGNTTAPIP